MLQFNDRFIFEHNPMCLRKQCKVSVHENVETALGVKVESKSALSSI